MVCSKNNRLIRKNLRDTSNPFGLPEIEFKKMFRLSHEAARNLLNELTNNNPRLLHVYSNGIPFHLRFLAALNFFGHGSYQKPTAENRLYCQAQSSMSISLHLTCNELLKLCGEYIKYPSTREEIATAKLNYMMQLGMPGIVSAIDGTHVAIRQPAASENGYLYHNRKHFSSLNVLLACSADQMILFANANYPGSVHDSAIWQMSGLKQMVQRDLDDPHFILGDSGYPAERCLLTPVLDARDGSKEAAYNKAHKKARNVIERTIGCLKMRFRCLQRHRTLHYNPKTAGKIIYACIILHNICISQNIADEDGNDEVGNDDEDADVEVDDAVDGRHVRDQYIMRYF